MNKELKNTVFSLSKYSALLIHIFGTLGITEVAGCQRSHVDES